MGLWGDIFGGAFSDVKTKQKNFFKSVSQTLNETSMTASNSCSANLSTDQTQNITLSGNCNFEGNTVGQITRLKANIKCLSTAQVSSSQVAKAKLNLTNMLKSDASTSKTSSSIVGFSSSDMENVTTLINTMTNKTNLTAIQHQVFNLSQTQTQNLVCEGDAKVSNNNFTQTLDSETNVEFVMKTMLSGKQEQELWNKVTTSMQDVTNRSNMIATIIAIVVIVAIIAVCYYIYRRRQQQKEGLIKAGLTNTPPS